jgi:hypothetical protein
MMRWESGIRLAAAGLVLGVSFGAEARSRGSGDEGRPVIAAYYFPNYHAGDPRNERDRGAGWSEWDLVKAAKPRFEGHAQPKVPAWGYTDESDPKAMAQKIDAAADHGVDAFIFDWYYYDDGPFLDRGLERGYLKAANNRRVKFALMWANHDWIDIFPRTLKHAPKLMYPGKIKPETWDRLTDYVIEKYFKHPSHWKIDGRPYFSIYELHTFAASFGSGAEAKAALGKFRDKTKAAGFPGLHLDIVMWGNPILPGETAVKKPADAVRFMGFDSVGSYVWVHHSGIRGFPSGAYADLQKAYFNHARQAMTMYGVPYYPNVSMGWDASPRTKQDDPFENKGYPFMAVLTGNTPAAFEAALREAKALLETRPAAERILTVNSWNEWTEGSYLEPDTVNGTKYLEAIRAVFGAR